MKTSFTLFIMVVFFFFPGSGKAGELTGNFNVTAGPLFTDEDFSEAFDLDSRVELGVTGDAKQRKWPIYITVTYLVSYGNGKIPDNTYGLLKDKDVDIFCSETYLGIKKIFDYPAVKPYLAGGVNSLNIYADISYDDEYDSAIGTWYGAGAYFSIFQNWHLNLEWRRSRAEVELFDHKLDAGGDHFMLAIGYHFPQ